MYLHIGTIIFLMFEYLSKVLAQGVPMTPCPKIFQYRFNGSEWFGILAVPYAPHDKPLHLHVTLSVSGKLESNYFGEIQLLTRGQFFSDGPVFYKIVFPKIYVIPKLLQVTVNGQVICIGAPDLSIFMTQIQLEHTRKFTFLPREISTPTQHSASLPFLPSADAMKLDGGHSTIEMKGVSAATPATHTAFNAKHFPFNTKEKSPLQNLKESCGAIDEHIHFDVLQALKQARPSDASVEEDYTDNNESLPVDESDRSLKTADIRATGKLERPLIISNISDDSSVSRSKQASIMRGAWPWLAAIYVNNFTSLVYHCSGTLVSPRVVISAAHCFQLFKQHHTAKEVLVFLGRHNLLNWSEEGSLAAPVDEIYIHPDFNENLNSYDADIVVLVLRNEVRLNSFIRPACLWSGPTEPEYMEGHQGVVVSWRIGSKYFPTFNAVPKVLSAPIVSNNACFEANTKYENLSSNRTFCAGMMLQNQPNTTRKHKQTYHGPCTGDSGAGLMIFKKNRWMLRGLVSGLLPSQPINATSSNPKCSINQFVIYTDVAQFLDWIVSFII